MDTVDHSQLRWEDNLGHEGSYNFTNPNNWNDKKSKTEQFLVYDSPDFVNGHRADDDMYDVEPDDEDYDPWFGRGTEVQNVRVLDDQDYYDYLMRRWDEEQASVVRQSRVGQKIKRSNKDESENEETGPMIVEMSPEEELDFSEDSEALPGVEMQRPCTSNSPRFCNPLFVTFVVCLALLILCGCYFVVLFCYIQVSFPWCTSLCLWYFCVVTASRNLRETCAECCGKVNLTKQAEPLRELLRQDIVWCWDSQYQKAFDTVKQDQARHLSWVTYHKEST